ncbi:hypothetical protein RZS08_06460, partial [Arthrospira platensis SPKY1]|nr:hypothetical protein [Arthrospira platensis SPKY1]
MDRKAVEEKAHRRNAKPAGGERVAQIALQHAQRLQPLGPFVAAEGEGNGIKPPDAQQQGQQRRHAHGQQQRKARGYPGAPGRGKGGTLRNGRAKQRNPRQPAPENGRVARLRTKLWNAPQREQRAQRRRAERRQPPVTAPQRRPARRRRARIPVGRSRRPAAHPQ